MLILASAELFTNAVEWVGNRFSLSQGAVGSVLAAVGTALPESVIPVVAITLGAAETGHDIGLGAILGAPFMLGTLAFLVTGLAVFFYAWRRGRPVMLRVDRTVISRDLRYFLGAYTVAVAGAFLPVRGAKLAVAAILLVTYLVYLYKTLSGHDGEAEGEGSPPPLFLARRAPRPALPLILLQLFSALAMMIGGSQIFVMGIEDLAPRLGLPAFLLSLIIAPIATELPEKFNSVIWIGREKDTLALGNITGAMVFQSSVIPSIGIFLTPWSLNVTQLFTAFLALLSAGLIYAMIQWRGRLSPHMLLSGGVFYVVYLAMVL